MLTLDWTVGRQKFVCLFSLVTLKLNEWMSFQKKMMCTPKDPRAPRKMCAQYASTLCLYYRLHLMELPVQHMQFQNCFVLSWVFQLSFGSFKDVFCYFWAVYCAFAYLLLIYEIWKIYWITKASKLLHRKKKTNYPDPKPLEAEKLCKELTMAWCGCISGIVFS